MSNVLPISMALLALGAFGMAVALHRIAVAMHEIHVDMQVDVSVIRGDLAKLLEKTGAHD